MSGEVGVRENAPQMGGGQVKLKQTKNESDVTELLYYNVSLFS